MKFLNMKLISVSFFLILFSTGCINVNKNFKNIRDNVLSNFDETFKTELEFALGPSTMHFASAFVKLDKENGDKDLGLMLRQVNRIQIGIYKKADNSSFEKYRSSSLKDLLENDNWIRIVINKEADSVSEVFVKEDDAKLKQMLVVNAETDQMIIVELSGDLDELIAIAIANNGFNIVKKE